MANADGVATESVTITPPALGESSGRKGFLPVDPGRAFTEEGGWPTDQASRMLMTVLWIIVPLMVVAIAIATIPVLVGSVRHNRAMRSGRIETLESAREEADFWNRMLGRRRGHRAVPTPELLTDEEVARTSARPEHRQTVDVESVWITPL